MSTVYKKQFDLWNEKKKHVEARAHSENLYLYEREVWWCSVGVNIGVEIDGKNNDFERPVLVIKRFNSLMFWVIPLTSQAKTRPAVLEVKHPLGSSFANLAQLRLFSTKRVLRKVGMVSENAFVDVRLALQDLFKINRPSP
jgi:mRNA interferase MazF